MDTYCDIKYSDQFSGRDMIYNQGHWKIFQQEGQNLKQRLFVELKKIIDKVHSCTSQKNLGGQFNFAKILSMIA